MESWIISSILSFLASETSRLVKHLFYILPFYPSASWSLWRRQTNLKIHLKWFLFCLNCLSSYHGFFVEQWSFKVQDNWSLIWESNVSPKFKHSLWHFLKHCLSTSEKLISKGVSYPPNWCFCSYPFENVYGPWSTPKTIQLKVTKNLCLICFSIFNIKKEPRLWLFFGVWKNWNNKVWGNIDSSPTIVVSQALQYFSKWLSARNKSSFVMPTPIAAPTSYMVSSSTRLYIKCNIDAAMFKDQNSFDIGLCLWDDFGTYIKARTQLFPIIPQPQEGNLDFCSPPSHSMDTTTLVNKCCLRNKLQIDQGQYQICKKGTQCFPCFINQV